MPVPGGQNEDGPPHRKGETGVFLGGALTVLLVPVYAPGMPHVPDMGPSSSPCRRGDRDGAVPAVAATAGGAWVTRGSGAGTTGCRRRGGTREPGECPCGLRAGRPGWRCGRSALGRRQRLLRPRPDGGAAGVVVPGTSVADWQAVLDLVEESGWTCRSSEGGAGLPMPRAEAVLSRPAEAERAELRVRPITEVLAIFRFHSAEEIDFDVDLREPRARTGSTCSATSLPRSAGAWASRC